MSVENKELYFLIMELEKKIIFFDQDCELCNRFIKYVFKKDLKKQFFYAPLQGQHAKKLLEAHLFESRDSIVFFDQGKTYKESEATIKIFKMLYPKTTKILFFLPFSFYNLFYRQIAKNRYSIFGKNTKEGFPEISKERLLD